MRELTHQVKRKYLRLMQGNFLADSPMKTGTDLSKMGNNIGCPAEKEEVDYFVKMLKKTSPLTDQQLTLIQQHFLKNKE